MTIKPKTNLRPLFLERQNKQQKISMSSDFLKARLRAQETEFQRRNDLNAYKTIRETLKATGQLEVSVLYL